eukprot:4698124-Amphidinium_carterae.2
MGVAPAEVTNTLNKMPTSRHAPVLDSMKNRAQPRENKERCNDSLTHRKHRNQSHSEAVKACARMDAVHVT